MRIFLAFSLSITSIFLLLIIPKYLFSNFNVSIAALLVGLFAEIVYCVKNKHLIKSALNIARNFFTENKALFVIWSFGILLMIIPALHHPWYFGYGVDWVNHVSLVKDTVINNLETFYPAISVHAFLAIPTMVGFKYPDLFQIGVAFILGLSLLPLYLICKRLLNDTATKIALLLWLIIPYHFLLYGEFIPNAASIFFHLSLFLLIFTILQNHRNGEKKGLNFLIATSGLTLGTIVYTHQVFLYTFFWIYALISIMFVFNFGKFKWLTTVYSKIAVLATILTLPFLKSLYSGTEFVLEQHSGKKTPYSFSDFLMMTWEQIGFIAFALGIFGTFLYWKASKSKNESENLSGIIMASLFLGCLASVNVYFGGNPFWSERSWYVLTLFILLPIAYAISSFLEKHKKTSVKTLLVLVFITLLLNKIDYSFKIDAVWSKEIHSSIEWAQANEANLKDKKIYLVFNDIASSSVNHVFHLGFNRITNLPVEMIDKTNYQGRPGQENDLVLLDTNYYKIIRNGYNIYFDYKVEILKSYDALTFANFIQTKPELTYTLDKIIKRHFYTTKIDQQSKYVDGKGIAIGNGRVVGQQFIPEEKVISEICINLSRSTDQPASTTVVLLEDGKDEPIKVSTIGAEASGGIPIGTYQPFCFPIEASVVPGKLHMFNIINDSPTLTYGVLNAGKQGYPFASAYDNGVAMNDNLLFATKTFKLFSW